GRVEALHHHGFGLREVRKYRGTGFGGFEDKLIALAATAGIIVQASDIGIVPDHSVLERRIGPVSPSVLEGVILGGLHHGPAEHHEARADAVLGVVSLVRALWRGAGSGHAAISPVCRIGAAGTAS